MSKEIEERAEDEPAASAVMVKYTKPLDRTMDERVEAEQELPPGLTEEEFFLQNPSYQPSAGAGEEDSEEEEEEEIEEPELSAESIGKMNTKTIDPILVENGLEPDDYVDLAAKRAALVEATAE